jgi:hypothetical protein
MAKLSKGWDAALLYFEIPAVMFVFAVVVLALSWALINQKR